MIVNWKSTSSYFFTGPLSNLFTLICAKNIDFYEPFSEYEIYNENAYKNIRPVLKDFLSDYKVEQTKDDFNKKILDIQKQEEKEIAENLGEISIKRDPRITKYEDTYSITPYATYLLTPLSDIDGEDIVSRFDRCYGEWVNKRHEKCHKNQFTTVLSKNIMI